MYNVCQEAAWMATVQLCSSSSCRRSLVQSLPWCSSLLSVCVVDAITTVVRRRRWRGHLSPGPPSRQLVYRLLSPTTGWGRRLRGFEEALMLEWTKRHRWCYRAVLRQADSSLINNHHTCQVRGISRLRDKLVTSNLRVCSGFCALTTSPCYFSFSTSSLSKIPTKLN